MQDTLELVPIAAPAEPNSPLTPAAAAARAVVPLRQAALARFSAAEAHLTDMRNRYAAVQWDTSTPKGLEAAKEARQEMRQEGRYLIQKLVEKTKGELNDLKTDVVNEGERLIALIAPEEDRAHKAITEAEGRARQQRERKRKLEEDLAVIRGYVEMGKGRPSVDIARGIAYVQKLDVSVETWGEDFAPKAVAARDETVEKLTAMQLAAIEAERRDEEERQRREHQQGLMEELQGLAQQVIIAQAGRAGVREGGTIECIRETLAETEAWELPAEHWGVLHTAALTAKAGAVAQIRGLLQAAEAALAARAAPPAPSPAPTPAPQPEAGAPAAAPAPQDDGVTARALAAFRDDIEPEAAAPAAEPAPAPAAAPAPATLAEAIAEEANEAAAEPAQAADPAVDPRTVPTLGVNDINARFGEGMSMNRAFIEGALNVPAEGLSPRKTPLWSENGVVSIAVALRDLAHEIAVGER